VKNVFAGVFALLLALSGPVAAKPPAPAASAASANGHSTQARPDESQLVEHKTYTNRTGESVHSPAHTVDGAPPPGATAHCRDGSFSFSQSRRGTCSHHGGVSNWL
jgi:hypothetical protein